VADELENVQLAGEWKVAISGLDRGTITNDIVEGFPLGSKTESLGYF